MPPEDLAPVDRLLDAMVARAVDAVTFTSAPAAASLLLAAPRRADCCRSCSTRCGHDVLPACVGPVTALPLQARGVPTVQPERFRLGPLVQLLCRRTARRGPGRCRSRGAGWRSAATPSSSTATLRPVPPAGMALLRALARRPGWVVSRADLLRALPGAGRTSTPWRRRWPACGRPSARPT